MHFDPNKLFYTMAAAYSDAKKRDKRLIICNEGGSRSGKTYATFDLLIAICSYNINAGLDIYILRDTLINCRDFTLKDFQKDLQICQIYDESKMRYYPKPYYNLFGNNIYFRGLDDEKNTEGYPSDILFINEVLETEQSKVQGLLMRCRKLVIFDWNPKLTKHWVFDYEGREDVLFTRTTYKDNKHLEQTIIDEIESYNPEIEANVINKTANLFRWKVYGLGVRADQEGNVFNDSQLNKFELSDIPVENCPKIAWCDVADMGTDYLCYLVGAIYDKKIYIIDVVYSGKSIDYTAPLILELIEKWNISISVFESNGMGTAITRNVKMLAKDRYKNTIKASKAVREAKHSRIVIQAETNIIPNFYFKKHQTGMYADYYDNLTNYKHDKSVKQDDAPDATAGLSILAQKYL